MIIFCSIVTFIFILGSGISIYQNKTYWPFDNYPMYSFPVQKMRYPLYDQGRLVMLTIVDSSNGGRRDLIAGPSAYPPEFFPLDRLEIILLLVKGGFFQAIEKEASGRTSNHFRYASNDWKTGSFDQDQQKLLSMFLSYIRTHNSAVESIRVEKLEWMDVWNEKADYRKPDIITPIIEVTHG